MSDLPEWMDPKFIYDEGGYDLGQIRWMLSLTPAERLENLQDIIDFFEEVRTHNATLGDCRRTSEAG